MSNATLTAIRTLHEITTRPEKTMTAREMALTSHNLSKSGDQAVVNATGEVYTWDARRQVWGF